MRKSLVRIIKSFQISLTYRSEIFLWFLIDSVPTLVMLLVWGSIYTQSETIRGYDLSTIITYYLLTAAIDRTISAHFTQHRVQEIREGKIDFYLIRPFSYLKELVTSHIGSKLFSYCISIPLLIGMFALVNSLYPLGFAAPSSSQLLQIGILLTFGFIFNLCADLLIVIAGFWLEQADGLEHFKWISTSLFSGSLMPLVFLPLWLQSLADALPFKYLYSAPILVFQNSLTLNQSDYLLLALYAVGAVTAILALWKKALYTYSSVGG